MADRFPDARLFWIMGGDQWESLPRWKNPERLAELVELIVLARGEPIEPRKGYRLHVIDGQHHASATKIRETIESGKSTHPWIDARVTAWIARRKLYQP
jgi:nicotinate-nucleotide adenylyltransferase